MPCKQMKCQNYIIIYSEGSKKYKIIFNLNLPISCRRFQKHNNANLHSNTINITQWQPYYYCSIAILFAILAKMKHSKSFIEPGRQILVQFSHYF